MKLTFEIAAFAEAARIVSRVPSSAMQIDILDHARLEASGKSMSLTMSDLDIEARVTLDCSAESDVLVAIPRAILEFFAVRADGKDGEGILEFGGEPDNPRDVTARAGRARITMPVLRGTDFPLLAAFEPEWSFPIRGHELCAALKRVERAMLPNDPTFWKDGVYLHQPGDGVAVIGTDGGRIHLVDVDAVEFQGALPRHSSQPKEGLAGIIVPSRTIKELQRIFGDDESEIAVAGTGRMVAVEGQTIRIASKLIETPFFGGQDYRIVVPERPEAHVKVASDRMLRAIRSLLVVPKTEAKGKKATTRAITITFGVDAITMTTRGDVGDSEEVVEAENTDVAENLSITFDARFLSDAIDAVGTPQILIHPPAEIGKPFHISGAEGVTVLIGQRRP